MINRRLKSCFLAFVFACLASQPIEAAQIKVCTFNFAALDLESAGFGTTISQMLNEYFRSIPNLQVLDRKELEQFLSLNDLQQNDNLDNIVSIGSRLGLDIVVTGSIGRSGQILRITVKAVQIDQKKFIFNTQVRALGEAGLSSEVKTIGDKLAKALTSIDIGIKEDVEAVLEPPASVEARPGSMSVILKWGHSKAIGFKVFRAASESGPFTNIGNVKVSEFVDQGLEKKKAYFYKIRAFDDRGLQSDFSKVVSCETEAVPNPPIIIKSEGRIKGIHLTFSTNPTRSEDPLKIIGFKLYRSSAEVGPYKEMVKITGEDLSTAVDQSNVKFDYVDKVLLDGQTFFYKLTSINEKGLESEFSWPIKGVSVPAISGLQASGDMIREIHLDWDRVDSPLVAGYHIYRSTSENKDFSKIKSVDPGPAETKKLSYKDLTCLSDMTRYFYKVSAFKTLIWKPQVFRRFRLSPRAPPVPKGLRTVSGQVKQVDLTSYPAMRKR